MLGWVGVHQGPMSQVFDGRLVSEFIVEIDRLL
jgi:hypothetical protein